MRDVALSCRGLSKTYRVYRHPSDVLREVLTGRRYAIERDVLKAIDLEVRRGEVVGILGRNGAGKSTLLRIVAGTLEATAGTVQLDGRVTAILELGTGFHPEYSGRENIALGGLCLGMSRQEAARKAPDIIAFSELEAVIDQPFRTYSTGMQARLTFATAISVDPDILIVDEALSVGDAKFQMKCFARMAELRRRGTTILFVSHDINAVTTFCDRAVILESGRVFAQGEAKAMCSEYLRLLFGPADATPPVHGRTFDEGERAAPAIAGAPAAGVPARQQFGDGAIALEAYGIVDAQGREVHLLESGRSYRLHFRGRCVRPVAHVSCGFAVKNRFGTVVFGVTNVSRGEPIDDLQPGEMLQITTDLTMWLAAGDYFVNLGFGHATGEMCDFVEDAVKLTVYGPGGIFTTALVNLQADYRVQRHTAPDVNRAGRGTPCSPPPSSS